MGTPAAFPSGIVVIGVLSLSNQPCIDLENSLDVFGSPTLVSPVVEFGSSYYTEEMGAGLYRQWIAMKPQLITDLAELKMASQSIESRYTYNGSRQFNIDPGILYPHNFILLTTKNYTHRIPIRDGIYAELELQFTHKQWNALPWTYPDYVSHEFITFLTQLKCHFT